MQQDRTYDQSALEAFGERLGHVVPGGLVIELIGDVGAGKTTFTKALARGMGITEPVQSPTFTISNRYTSLDGRELAHYDFYRLSDAGIMADELRETLGDPQVVTVIEWGDVIADVLPDDRLTLRFSATSETMRRLQYIAGGSKSRAVLGGDI